MIININDQIININTLNEYVIGDSTKISQYFHNVEPFVDLIVTSPPYWDMKDYEGNELQIGFKQNYSSYLNDIKKIFEGVFQISKDSANLVLIIDTMKKDGRMIRLPDDVARVLEEIGWIHQDTLIWDKVKTLPWSRKGQMRNVFEYILIFSKTQNYKYKMEEIRVVEDLKEWWRDYPERYNPNGKVPDNIWKFLIPTQGSWGTKKDFGEDEFKHACPFPPELMARLIKLLTDENDVVFDPFSGTGVLYAVAEKMNRRYLGLDVNETYKRVFEIVTRNLVNEMWPDIERYYIIQTKLKELMETSITKMRMLKYPQALLKSLKKLQQINFKLIIATCEYLPIEEQSKNIIGKVNYKLFHNIEVEDTSLENTNSNILELISKAPYTKYGLISNTEVLNTNNLIEELNSLNYPQYLYSSKNILNFSYSFNSANEILEFMETETFISLFDGNICPKLSNIKIREEDCELLPAEKYKKIGYREDYPQSLLDRLNSILSD